MRVLLDTNIIVHLERQARSSNNRSGHCFVGLTAFITRNASIRLSIDEIRKHKDPKVVSYFRNQASKLHAAFAPKCLGCSRDNRPYVAQTSLKTPKMIRPC